MRDYSNKKPLEIYIHIPFCQRKCSYCDFLSAPADEETREQYVRALVREICEVPVSAGEAADGLVVEMPAGEADGLAADYRVVSVFFGGGTPSILSGEQIGRIMAAVRARFELAADVEVTLEANPGTVDAEKLAAYRAAGINRLSLGLQSTEDAELRMLGRIHDYAAFLETYRLAREAGFDNINVDLMNSLPGQSPESWARSLARVTALGPEHISVYSLIVEEGTPFFELFGEDDRRRSEGRMPMFLPTEEEERRMYQQTGELLAAAGYERYEISNYARPGRACRHNEGYWTGVAYQGFGLGAASYIEETRFSNRTDLAGYVAALGDGVRLSAELREDICHLSAEERQEEFFFLGLRRMAGVSRAEYRARFGEDWTRYQENIDRLTGLGFLEETTAGIRLTAAGIDVSNEVFAELLA